jgi:hypothetical protein
MAKQLEITKILKRAIQIAEIEQNNLEYFVDKNKSGRRYKFYNVRPTIEQINYLNKLLQIAGINATAKILSAKKLFGNYVSPFSNNCLIIIAK